MRKGMDTSMMIIYGFAIVLTLAVLAVILITITKTTTSVCWGNFYGDAQSLAKNFPMQDGESVKKYVQLGDCVYDFGVFSLEELQSLSGGVSTALECPLGYKTLVVGVPQEKESVGLSDIGAITDENKRKELVNKLKKYNALCFAAPCKDCTVSKTFRYAGASDKSVYLHWYELSSTGNCMDVCRSACKQPYCKSVEDARVEKSGWDRCVCTMNRGQENIKGVCLKITRSGETYTVSQVQIGEGTREKCEG